MTKLNSILEKLDKADKVIYYGLRKRFLLGATLPFHAKKGMTITDTMRLFEKSS